MLTVNPTLTLETQSHLHRQRQTTSAHYTPRDTAGIHTQCHHTVTDTRQLHMVPDTVTISRNHTPTLETCNHNPDTRTRHTHTSKNKACGHTYTIGTQSQGPNHTPTQYHPWLQKHNQTHSLKKREHNRTLTVTQPQLHSLRIWHSQPATASAQRPETLDTPHPAPDSQTPHLRPPPW